MLKAAAEKEEGGLTVRIEHGDCREVIRSLADGSVDSCVTDPPYALVSIVKRFGGKNAAPVKVSEFFQENGDSKGSSPYLRASAGFMGKQWDTGEVAFDPAFWAEVLRVLKPGGHVLACGGTRSYHRLACIAEGFDCILIEREAEYIADIKAKIDWAQGGGPLTESLKRRNIDDATKRCDDAPLFSGAA